MSRIFSCIRRRPALVDIIAPLSNGIDTYRLKWAANFDSAVWTTIIDAPVLGFVDPAIDIRTLEVHQTSRMARIVFDPATYSIPDGSAFWLKLVHVAGGAEGTSSPPTLLLPDDAHHGLGGVILKGTAPLAADVSGSLQIDLPRVMSDIRFTNLEASGGTVLYVATEANGAEQGVPPAADAGQITLTLNGTESSLLVRGAGGTVAFSAACTAAFPR